MGSVRMNTKANYLYNLLYQMLNVIMPLATAPYIARVVGADGVGINSYYYSIANVCATVGMLGLTNYGSRSIAQCRENEKKRNKIFSSLFYMQIGLCLIITLIYIVYICLFVKNNTIIAWLQVFTILTAAINLNWFFWGIEEFKITVTRNCIVKIITFLSIFIFVKKYDDVWKYCMILTLGTFLGNLPLVILLNKYTKLVKVSCHEILRHFKPNLILFVPILATTLYRTIDKVMLGWLTDYNQVGYYENADKIINICLGCVTALGQVMMPRASSLITDGNLNECNRLVKKSFYFSSIFSSVVLFGLLSVSDIFVPLFFGKGFSACSTILCILSLSFVFLAWANVLKTQIVIARKKDSIYVRSTIIGVIVNIILNTLLIPSFKGNGAALATTVTEAIVFAFIALKIKEEIKIKDMLYSSTKYFIVGLIMFAIILLLKNFIQVNLISLVFILLIGGIVFTIGCFVLVKVFRDELMNQIFSIILKKFHIR